MFECDETPMTEQCPECGSETGGDFLGVLGTVECYRCRDCGWTLQTACETCD